MPLTMVRVCSFRGLQNLPLYVAQRQGYLAAQGLDLALTYTSGSAAQLSGLVRGEYDLVQTAPDNVVNCDTDPPAFGLSPAGAPRVVMVLGGSIGPLSLYARPGIADWEALRGATLGVDNPSSGFALVLRDLLGRRGLQLGRDYRLAVAGGTDVRCGALLSGEIAATILYMPYDRRAEAGGCARLASSVDWYPAYASAATAGVQPWLEAHGDLVARYIGAVLRALRWIYDPAPAELVREVLRAEPALGLDAELAERAYAAFVDPASGFGRDAPLDDAGLRQVIALRAALGAASGAARGSLGEPADYYDRRWYHQALSSLATGD